MATCREPTDGDKRNVGVLPRPTSIRRYRMPVPVGQTNQQCEGTADRTAFVTRRKRAGRAANITLPESPPHANANAPASIVLIACANISGTSANGLIGNAAVIRSGCRIAGSALSARMNALANEISAALWFGPHGVGESAGRRMATSRWLKDSASHSSVAIIPSSIDTAQNVLIAHHRDFRPSRLLERVHQVLTLAKTVTNNGTVTSAAAATAST